MFKYVPEIFSPIDRKRVPRTCNFLFFDRTVSVYAVYPALEVAFKKRKMETKTLDIPKAEVTAYLFTHI